MSESTLVFYPCIYQEYTHFSVLKFDTQLSSWSNTQSSSEVLINPEFLQIYFRIRFAYRFTFVLVLNHEQSLYLKERCYTLDIDSLWAARIIQVKFSAVLHVNYLKIYRYLLKI